MNRDHDAHPPTHSTDSHERGHSAASSQLLARAVTTAPGTPRRQRPPPPATGLSIELQLVRGIEPRPQCHWRDLLQRAPCSPLFSVITQRITVVVVLSPSPSHHPSPSVLWAQTVTASMPIRWEESRMAHMSATLGADTSVLLVSHPSLPPCTRFTWTRERAARFAA